MAKRKSMLSIDFNNFSDYGERLDKLGANLQKVFTDVMEETAKKVQEDTKEAVEKSNLPAKGDYSRGDTERSIVQDPKVQWSGSIGELPLGFDKTKPGVGTWLITGTPRMRPDIALQEIYGQKKYENRLNRDIRKRLQAEVDRIAGGNHGR